MDGPQVGVIERDIVPATQPETQMISTQIRKSLRTATAVLMLGTGAAIMTAPAAFAAPAGGYVDLIKQVNPAVVLIEVTQNAQPAQFNGQQMPKGFPKDFPWEQFGMQMPDAQPTQGLGTGFVISADGQIVTNAHVVDGADTVKVTLPDGRSFDAEVLGTDPATDIAVVKVDATDLPTLAFGDSDSLQVGQDVVAIGNPFGLGNSVTSGIVSALGRNINSGPFDDFIQTDAAINRGNSGGPLFNAEGQVVGMNTAIYSPSGGSVGIGFAVPSNQVERIVADLTDDGSVSRGWLGVQIQPVSEDVALALGLEPDSGAVIADVTADTPAAEAGLKRGDIVTAVNGDAVKTPQDLTRLIAGAAPGDEVTVNFLRSGDEQTITVILGTRPDQKA